MKITKAKGVKTFYYGNELLLPNQPYHDTFLQFMNTIFKWARCFGVPGFGCMLWQIWAAVVLTSLALTEGGAIWKVIRALAGWARDTANHRSVTARFAGAMFYAASLISQILCWRLSYNWRALSKYWASVEWVLNIKYVPPDRNLKKRLMAVTALMATGATVEHLMSILATTGIDCPISDIIKTYVLKSHGFLLLDQEYYKMIAVPVLFVSNIATILWNFQDILIVLISMGLTSRYHRLNMCVATVCSELNKERKWSKDNEILQVYLWRKIREAYVKQALLVRKINSAFGLILLFSNFFGFYFICLQLFLGITQGFTGDIFQKMYSLVSLAWICVRTCCVVLAAADIYENSKRALPYLYTCRAQFYNIEIERLQDQLDKDNIALSGLGFFNLTRTVLLQVASSVITYVLVLVQYDNRGDEQQTSNITNVNITLNDTMP
ncbi:gustatory receptor for sugar taste 64a-like [Pieris rapae]|uniref:gustatory receptor for sugar taste 64a-like n=1 Tax=Pieris rapae TaxID=64459 RepID=UPI001E27CBB8|nr:gustatory receptor for sugar taste 64a-like [Pieris rapae]